MFADNLIRYRVGPPLQNVVEVAADR